MSNKVPTKLTKLKSAIKRLPSIPKLRRAAATGASVAAYDDGEEKLGREGNSTTSLFPVYVGKSRRRYLLRAEVVDHPMFRELVAAADDDDSNNEDGRLVVACEVVLFEHLLWMLENSSSSSSTTCDSIEELVEFYK